MDFVNRYVFFFLFVKQKTAYEVRISDWSSDVCSSDLSIVDGSSVYSVRKATGAQLAIENPVEADYVIPVPDSGVPAAIGYAQQSGIPFELGIKIGRASWRDRVCQSVKI